jgi:nicotinamide mononucleotide transporter
LDGIIVLVLSSCLLISSHLKLLPIDFTEAMGFVTGAICVWLVAKDNIWNWPIGIANNIFFAILFWRTRLFADFGLQWVYLVLGLYGWWEWLHGGRNHSARQISRTPKIEWMGIILFLPLATWAMHAILLRVNGAAPFWDSLTTALSLAAQFLLCRKRIENWFLWILVDIIYVPLYIHRSLPLTATLYAFFIILCISGLHSWKKETLTK